jgi:hypothetical protein
MPSPCSQPAALGLRIGVFSQRMMSLIRPRRPKPSQPDRSRLCGERDKPSDLAPSRAWVVCAALQLGKWPGLTNASALLSAVIGTKEARPALSKQSRWRQVSSLKHGFCLFFTLYLLAECFIALWFIRGTSRGGMVGLIENALARLGQQNKSIGSFFRATR